MAAFALAFALTSHASAQNAFADTEQASRLASFQQQIPFGGLGEFDNSTRLWSVNTFYNVFRGNYPNRTSFWVVRRVTGGGGAAEVVVWADSRSCSGVERSLLEMERMPAVRPDVFQLGLEPRRQPIIMEASNHIFWNRWARSDDDAVVQLEMRGNGSSPIGRWWTNAVEHLSHCWVSEQPQ